MAEWVEFDPSVIMPDGIDDILSAAQSLTDALGTALDLMATVVDVASNFVGTFADIQAALIEAVYLAIDAVTQNLTETGIYATFHAPVSLTQRMSPSSWLYQVGNSVRDFTDSRRPVLPTPQFIGGVCVVCVSDTYRGLLDSYRGLFDMFKKFIASVEQLARWPQPDNPWEPKSGVGRAPDWKSLKLGDIVPPIGDLANKLQSFKDIIASMDNPKDMYKDFAELLSTKAELLKGWADQILSYLEILGKILGWQGAYALPIRGEFNEDTLLQELVSSTGGPRDIVGADYTAGAMFIGIGGAGTALLEMFGF